VRAVDEGAGLIAIATQAARCQGGQYRSITENRGRDRSYVNGIGQGGEWKVLLSTTTALLRLIRPNQSLIYLDEQAEHFCVSRTLRSICDAIEIDL
jgi:hypothetical protein